MSGALSSSYEIASWRNTTPVDDQRGVIGIGFDIPGRVVRLAIDLESARKLAESIDEYLTGTAT